MNNLRTHSLKKQLLKHLWIPLLILLTLGGIGSTLVAHQISTLVHDQWLLDSAMTLKEQINIGEQHVTLDLPQSAIEMFVWDRVDNIDGQVSTAQQGVIFSTSAFPEITKAASHRKPDFYNGVINHYPVRIVSFSYTHPQQPDNAIYIQVAETLKKRENTSEWILLVMCALEIVILLLTGLFIWMAVTRNVGKVDAVAEQLAKYQPEDNAPFQPLASVPREIEPLIDAINQLVKKIHEAQAFHKRFIANAAHQLRTPLSSLLLQIEYALRERDEQRHTHALEDAHRAVTRLQHVTRQLLTLMQSERQTASILQLKPLDLADLARGEVERFSDMALHREIDLGYEGPEKEVIINGEAHLLRELISNLLDNAIRYCPAQSTITLILQENPLCLSVLDDGPGIPPEEQRWVLERFYRGKTVIADGCGLGLSIADEIARRHQAQLMLRTGEHGKGTRVDILFNG
ncbi:sensor histidine kinase [Cellvibrio polysaccharolyticus]|uniref:histidine kinase n=1 Tax=Cellvibrio polysaccharolyticus TaxID=2082724 RepID=A0A928YUE0_9GAMM|nr:sensor histidine kinase [Cellvibrio polysaccharolyticus]MBE8717852.1 sensor histidine kinase [Cellvibrio polysaccharolyticus]